MTRPTIKDTFSAALVFALMRSGHISDVQGKALLYELERKPWWQRALGI